MRQMRGLGTRLAHSMNTVNTLEKTIQCDVNDCCRITFTRQQDVSRSFVM